MKRNLIIIFIIASIMNIFSDKKLDVTLLVFNTYSKTEENIEFLNKRVPEILKNYIQNKGMDKYNLDLAWERSKTFNEWTAKTDISAYENGVILKTNFVIYGNVTLDIKGYNLDLFLYNVNIRKNIYSIKKSSNENENLYNFLEEVSNELFTVINDEINKYLESRVTFKKLASFESAVGYPVPMGDYFDIQIGTFYMESGFNISYKLYKNNLLSIYMRCGIRTGFDFLVYNPKRVEGYFYELNFSFPVYCIIGFKNTFYLLPGLSFSNFINFYQQVGVDGKTRVYTTYSPGLNINLDFELPLKINRNIFLGMKNEFNFIFYPDSVENKIKPKFQYVPCFYVLYKLEDW
jgi:hypothetical protein